MATYIPGVSDVFPEPSLFTPDFSFIDKMLQRRQGLYEQGFAQVNSKYKFIDREVTNPANQQVKDRFVKDVKNNLRNLSAMDLSQQENVNAAMGVFAPFVKNSNVLGDQALTEHWKQQVDLGNSFRLRDGGKEFSEDNVNYVRMQQAQFAQDDPNSWNTYYQNRKSYTPYYNYNDEVKEAMKNFKPSSFETFKINGLDVVTEKDASAKEADIRRYLEGVLSQKAKNQMKIEAAVRYSMDIPNLANMYSTESQKELMMNNMNIQHVEKDMSVTKDPAQKAMLQQYIKTKKEENESIQRNLQNIKNGDFSYVKQNAENLSAAIYYNQMMGKFSEGFSYQDVSYKISGYESGLELMKQNRADQRQMRSLNAKTEAALNAGEFTVETPSIGEGDVDLPMNEAGYNGMIGSINGQITDQSMALRQHVLSMINGTLKPGEKELTIDDVSINRAYNWLKTGGPNGKPISKTDQAYGYIKKITELSKQKKVYQNTLEQITKDAYKNLTSSDQASIDADNKRVKGLPSIEMEEGGGSLSAEQLKKGLESGNFEYVPPAQFGFEHLMGRTNSAQIIMKGYDPSDPSKKENITYFVNPKSLNTVLEVQNMVYSSANKNLRKNIASAFTSAGGDKRFVHSRIRPYAGSNTDRSLNSMMNGLFPEYNVQTQGIGISAGNQGDVYYSFSTKGNQSSALSKAQVQSAKERLMSKGYNVDLLGTEGGGYELKVKGIDNVFVNNLRDYSSSEVLTVQEVSSYQAPNKYVSAPFTPKNSNTKFEIVKEYQNYYLKLAGADNRLYMGGFSDPTAAITTARNLTKNNNQLLNAYLEKTK